MWYTSSNDKALDFVRNFRETNKKLMASVSKGDVTFTPRIVTWACTSCDADFKKKECLSNGRYCAMNHKGTYVEGVDILKEDMRQKCLHQLLSADGEEDKWWQYMQYVHRMCKEEVTEKCSRLGHTEISRDFNKTMKCFYETFESNNPNNPNI